MNYRLTFESEQGSVYSYIDRHFEDGLEVGEWRVPFPNELGNSTAFGLRENLLQSDDCPIYFYAEPIVRVKVEDYMRSQGAKMKKFISLLFVLGFVLYLKPEFKFPDGSNSVKIKQVNGGYVASVGQQGMISLVVSENGKRIYIPSNNILYIIEE